METANGLPRIKPIIILPKGEMSKKDIATLNANHLCVVEAKDPSKVRFIEPPPEGYTVQEKAAIQLFRVIAAKPQFTINRSSFAEMYVDIILRGMIPERVASVPPVKK